MHKQRNKHAKIEYKPLIWNYFYTHAYNYQQINSMIERSPILVFRDDRLSLIKLL